VQALGELTPRQRSELGIELPDDVGQRDRQVELEQRVVKLVLETGVHRIRGLRELVPNSLKSSRADNLLNSSRIF